MSNQAPEMKKTGPDEYTTTDSLVRRYSKSSVEQEVETIQNRIDQLEKNAGIKSLRQQLEQKKALLDRMKQVS